MLNNPSKIVITGIGSVTSAGTTNELWDAVLSKTNCLSYFENDQNINLPIKVVGKVTKDILSNLHKKILRYCSTHSLLGAYALNECIASSGLSDFSEPDNGLLFSSASLGQDMLAKVYFELYNKPFKKADYKMLSSISNSGAAQILSTSIKLNGFVQGIEGASCSGLISLINASNLIKTGICKRVFCVVGDANLHPGTLLYYSRKVRMAGISYTFFGKIENAEHRELENYVIPFGSPDVSDRGVIAEAGAAILLELEESAKQRNAKIYGELEQSYFSFHADNFNGVDSMLLGLNRVLKTYKNINFDSCYLPIIGFYPMDVAAYSVTGKYFPGKHTFSAEPIIGHTGAASSFINIILALKSMEHKKLLPTKNYDIKLKDNNCLLVPSTKIKTVKNLHRVLVVSTGFGGYNGSCSIKQYD